MIRPQTTFRTTCSSGVTWTHFVIVTFLLLVGFEVAAQRVARDSDLKATLLFNFSHFAHWPDESLGLTNTPFVIGIIGADPFGKFLDDLVINERAEGHPIEVRRITKPGDAAAVQMLFIPRTEMRRAPGILAAIDNKPVLTVCEALDRSAGTHGCVVAFVNKDNSIRIRIDLDRARKTGIVISSKVLHFAEITQAN